MLGQYGHFPSVLVGAPSASTTLLLGQREYMLKTERNHFLYIIATFKKITYPFFERQQQES